MLEEYQEYYLYGLTLIPVWISHYIHYKWLHPCWNWSKTMFIRKGQRSYGVIHQEIHSNNYWWRMRLINFIIYNEISIAHHLAALTYVIWSVGIYIYISYENINGKLTLSLSRKLNVSYQNRLSNTPQLNRVGFIPALYYYLAINCQRLLYYWCFKITNRR